jgi:hypothetical protein
MIGGYLLPFTIIPMTNKRTSKLEALLKVANAKKQASVKVPIAAGYSRSRSIARL